MGPMGSLHPKVAAAPHLTGALLAAKDLFPDAPTLLTKDDTGAYSRVTTLAAFVTSAGRVAAGLAELGLVEEDRVGIWADQSPAWNLADVAAAMNRCATVGIYANEPLADIVYKINDARMAMILVDRPDRFQALASVPAREIPTLRMILYAGLVSPADPRVVPFARLLESGARPVQDRIGRIRPDDLLKLMYTSGTTGRPKGVMVTQANLLANVAGFIQRSGIEPGHVFASYLPSAHILQALMDYTAMTNGCALAYSHKTTLKDDLARMRPHYLPGVPKVFKTLLDGMGMLVDRVSEGKDSLFSPSFRKDLYAAKVKGMVGLDRAAYCMSGGAKLDAETIRLYKERLDLDIDEGYGISETAGGVSIGGPGGRRLGKCGKPIPELDLKVVDDARRPVPPGTRGEIAVKGAMVFPGYLNRPDATAKVLVDGWYYTGDRGVVDESGFVEVFGRIGNRVKFANGEYYDLEEIGDRFLRRARLIGQIAAAGEQKTSCVALVTLSEDLLAAQALAKKLGISFISPRELIHHPAIVGMVRQEFEVIRQADIDAKAHPYERIEKIIYLRPFSADNGEATPTQKTRLRHILDKYEREIAALYASNDTFRVLEAP